MLQWWKKLHPESSLSEHTLHVRLCKYQNEKSSQSKIKSGEANHDASTDQDAAALKTDVNSTYLDGTHLKEEMKPKLNGLTTLWSPSVCDKEM